MKLSHWGEVVCYLLGAWDSSLSMSSWPPAPYSHPVVLSRACGFWYGRGCLDTVLRWSAFGGDRSEFRWTLCSLLNVLLFVSFERFPNDTCREKTEKSSVSEFILLLLLVMTLYTWGEDFVLDPHVRGIQNCSKKNTIWLVQKAYSFSAVAKGLLTPEMKTEKNDFHSSDPSLCLSCAHS